MVIRSEQNWRGSFIGAAFFLLPVACEGSSPDESRFQQQNILVNVSAGHSQKRVDEHSAEVSKEIKETLAAYRDPVSFEQAEADKALKKLTLAGGCFWCLEPPFEKRFGVVAVISGYAGGTTKDPTYKQVSSGMTDYLEAVQVYYDPAKTDVETLLEVFWQTFDPTDATGQFADRGTQYEPALYYRTDEEKAQAEKSKASLEKSERFDDPIVVPIRQYTNFYPAEEYHQDYYRKEHDHYARYREGSGRAPFLRKTWGYDVAKVVDVPFGDESSAKLIKRFQSFTRPSDDELKKKLNPTQYKVTQHEGTESPFRNEFWDNKAAGVYVDIVSGEPLFSSTDKFKSGTGWPSFTRPIHDHFIVEKKDLGLGMVRVEVRSRYADSHLGHVFDDGPQPTGLRYCINSASLKFVPKEKLESEGLGAYQKLFEK